MTTHADPPLVSDAEVRAAIAEAEALGAELPSLDQGTTPVVPIPVPVAAAPPRGAPAQPPAAARVVVVQTPTAPLPEVAAPGSPAAETESAAPVLPTSRWGRWLYVTIDRILWALNAPFVWLRPGARAALGWIAAASLIVTLIVPWLLPALCGPRTATERLRVQAHAVATAAARQAEAPPADP